MISKEAQAALKHCMKLLARRAYSRAELGEKLNRLGFSQPVVQSTLNEASARHWIDEWTYAKALLQNALSNGWGEAYARQLLQRKKLPEHIVTTVLQETEKSVWFQTLLKQGKKWLKREKSGASHQVIRLKSYLLKKGFSIELVERATQALISNL